MEQILFQGEINKYKAMILESIYQWKFKVEPTTTLINSGQMLKMWSNKLIAT